jgi:ATP-binding cassette subfamily E protein 1
LEDNIKAIIKPQYVDNIPRMVSGEVDKLLANKQDLDNKDTLIKELDLGDLLDREVNKLSGGELQRFAIAMACVQNADMYVAIQHNYVKIKGLV